MLSGAAVRAWGRHAAFAAEVGNQPIEPLEVPVEGGVVFLLAHLADGRPVGGPVHPGGYAEGVPHRFGPQNPLLWR